CAGRSHTRARREAGGPSNAPRAGATRPATPGRGRLRGTVRGADADGRSPLGARADRGASGWLILGVAACAAPLLNGAGIDVLAGALGGVLLGWQALTRLAFGVADLAGAA